MASGTTFSPQFPNLEDLVVQAMADKRIRPQIKEEGYDSVRKRITTHIQKGLYQNMRLAKSAERTDSFDSKLAAWGLLNDGLKVTGVPGYALSVAKEAVE